MSDQDFERNARQLLRLRVAEGSPNGVNYAPDTHYDPAKRCAVVGPLTIQILKILRRHASLWALEMRTKVNPTSEDGRIEWLGRMREADAEIKRYLAGPTFSPGAAA
jgi:hypothetical protein